MCAYYLTLYPIHSIQSIRLSFPFSSTIRASIIRSSYSVRIVASTCGISRMQRAPCVFWSLIWKLDVVLTKPPVYTQSTRILVLLILLFKDCWEEFADGLLLLLHCTVPVRLGLCTNISSSTGHSAIRLVTPKLPNSVSIIVPHQLISIYQECPLCRRKNNSSGVLILQNSADLYGIP